MPPKTAVLFVTLLATSLGCKTAPDTHTKLQRFEFAQAQMGLEFRITLFAESEPLAIAAATAAFDRISELNAVLSDYDSDSELSQLSLQSGSDTWIPISNDLWEVLVAGQQLSRESNGAFDLTIGPSVNLWRRARRQMKLPDADLLALMKERVGYQNLHLNHDRRSAKLSKPKMRLDAGGIAKGFAMDEAIRILRDHDVNVSMIHGGGDMVFGNPPPGRDGWRIQLTEAESPTLAISNAALATSGDLVQFLEIDGIRYSHIIDPRTGIGLTNRSLVHVIAPNGMLADSLSTTLNILGNVEAKELLKLYPEVETRITTVTSGERITFQTDGFSGFFTVE